METLTEPMPIMKRAPMRKVVIAFDVDGTLRNNTKGGMVANERIRTLLIILASFKNVNIIVWSGGGQLYAKQAVRELHLTQYVKTAVAKGAIEVDIAVDDIQECDLGLVNLIVREK